MPGFQSLSDDWKTKRRLAESRALPLILHYTFDVERCRFGLAVCLDFDRLPEMARKFAGAVVSHFYFAFLSRVDGRSGVLGHGAAA